MHVRRSLFRLFCAAALALAGAAAWAQTQTGNIYVEVTDTHDRALPHVTVTLQTSPVQIQLTDAQGQLRFIGVAPGNYRLTAELAGFTPYEQQARVAVGRNLSIGLTLSARISEVPQSDESIPRDR